MEDGESLINVVTEEMLSMAKVIQFAITYFVIIEKTMYNISLA
jgi:hypothetical protein